jgi:hypothetical protein
MKSPIFANTVAVVDYVNPDRVNWPAIAALGAVVAVLWAIWEHYGRKRAEKKLAEIKRRGDAPFLRVSDAIFGNILYVFGEGQSEIWHSINSHILCFQRSQVEGVRTGGDVVLVVDDAGEPTHKIIVKLDDAPIIFASGTETNTSKEIRFLKYPYDPRKQGQEQRITVSFETRSGAHDTHIYTTRHGVRFLERTNPALPQ